MEIKFFARIFSFLPLLLAVLAADTYNIEPNYDNPERKLKIFDLRRPIVLHCHVTNKGKDHALVWYKNDKKIHPNAKYKIKHDEDKLIIEKGDVSDDGNYACELGDTRKEFKVVATVQVRTTSNTGVVEGEKLQIFCDVLGTAPILTWVVGGKNSYNSSSGRYILKAKDKVENAIFVIENVSLDDRGEYKCEGRNDANLYTNAKVNSDTAFVRVKGKYAALWPFLGICAEVLLLCLIILIYEKRRNKTELEESDTDPQDQ